MASELMLEVWARPLQMREKKSSGEAQNKSAHSGQDESAALPENSGSTLSTHIAAHNYI